MLKTSKKVISLLLVVLMMFTAFPLQVLAEETHDHEHDHEQIQFETMGLGNNYCATAAAQWAKDHWNDYDSILLGTGYWYDGGDCANFVSQCLYMGGMDMSTYWNTNGYLAHWTQPHGNQYAGSYVRCVQLYNFLVKMGAQVIKNPKASDVSIGDVILYNNPSIGRLNHSAIVIDIKNGEPVIAAHSVNGVRYRTDDPYKEWHLGFSASDTYLMKLDGLTCVNNNPRSFDVYTASGGDMKLYKEASTSKGYHTKFLSGEYAHVYKKSADGQWGYTFRYGHWGWIRLSNFNYRTHIESAPVSHIFGDWFVDKVADCKNDGIDKRVCKRCGYTETKTTKGGHIIDPKATCLDAGFCKICGEQCENPLGHNWDAGKVTTQPNCTKEGVKTFICKRDSSHVRTEPVAALGHDYKVSATSPTCTAHGETIYKCSRCSDSYIVANPNGGWSDWTEDATLASTLPQNKVQTKTQYSYRDKEFSESSSSSKDGWTHYDTKRTSWGATQGPVYSDPSNGSRNVWSEQYTSGYNKKTVYVLYKYGAYELDYSSRVQTASQPNYYEVVLDKLPTSVNDRPVGKSGSQYQWHADGTGKWAAVYDGGTRTVDDTSRPIKSTRWYYQEPVYTYYFWKWNGWSGWQDNAVSSNSNREVKTRTLYKYDLTALGHAWKDDAKVQVCKCGTDESADYCYAVGQVCSRCGATNSAATKYYNHNYGAKYQVSNVNGVITYREDCQNSNCDCYRITTTSSCNFKITSEAAATCTTDGYEIWTCTYHGETKKITTTPKLGHNVPANAQGVIIKPATCAEDGILRKYCERYDNGKTCSHYVDTPIPAFGHTMTKYDAITATCIEDGRSEYYQCELCNGFFADKNGKTEIEKDSWIIDAYGHVSTDSVEWIVVEENGCGKTGWKHKLCDREIEGKVCNAVIDEAAIPEITPDIQVIRHNEYVELVDGEWVPTSCEYDGIIYLTCMNCYGTDHAHSRLPDVIEEPVTIGRLEHAPGNWIVDEETICIYPGHQHKECTRCGTFLEEEIIEAKYTQHLLAEVKYGDGCIDKDCVRCDYFEKGTHKFQRDTSRDVAPTCTERGLQASTCSICGKYDDVELDELGHDHKFVKTTTPTCTTAGYDVYTCERNVNGKVCGDTYETNPVSPLGHDLKKTDAVEPLCEKDGNIRYYTCQRSYCQKIFENEDANTELKIADTVIAQLGHEPDNNWVVIKEPTCSEKGEEQCKCVRHDDGKTCEKTYSRELEIVPDAHDWDEGVIDPSATCITHGTKTYTCQNDNSHKYTEEVAIDPDNHVGSTYIKDQKDATCEVDGYTGDIHCSDCDKMLEEGEVIPAFGHDWGEWTTVKEAVCEEDGLERRICKNDASHIQENVLEKIGHDWNDGVIDPSSTCNSHGTKTYTCQNDNSHQYTEEVAIDPDNHVGSTYIKDQKDATCEVDGYTGDIHCSDCDKMLEEGEVIPAFGHDWGEWTTVKEAVCEENGLERRICKNDASHIQENVLEMIGHDWDDGVVYTEPTCKNYGSMIFTCRNDESHKNVKYIIPLDIENHVGETYIQSAREATCEVDGYTGDTYCADCDRKIKDGEVIPAHGHDWGEWTTVTPATCEVEGLEQRICKIDASHIEKNKLAAIGHDWDDGVVDPSSTCRDHGTKTYTCQNDNTHQYTEQVELNPDNHVEETYIKDQKAPTCEGDGYTGDTYCSGCDKKLKDGEVIPKHGHDWGEWTTVTPATCENNGLEQRVCKIDASHIEENPLEAIGHDWDDGVVDSESTCNEQGKKTYTCKNDDSHKKTEELPINPDNHVGETYVDGAKDATCNGDGYTGDTYCSDCDKKLEDGEVIPEHGHDWGEWQITDNPTCDGEGTKERVCKRDSSHTEKESVPATGHNAVVDAAVEPTCTQSGLTAGSHCSSCGAVLEAQEKVPELGHDMGEWYVKTQAGYGVEGVEQRDCSRGDKSETRPIPALVKSKYTATFVIGDKIIGTVVFEEGAKSIKEPEIPERDNYIGYWEDYELKDENIVINGYYELKNSDSVSDIIPGKEAEYKDGVVEITLSASAESKKVNVISENTTPVDVVLVLDQSGSMKETLGSGTPKIDALVNCANDFVDKIYANAAATGADHRVAVVGFAMGNYTSDSKNYPIYKNTAVLTTGGAPVNYTAATSNVYSNALMSIVGSNGEINPDVKNVLKRSNFDPLGATAADLGLEMANLIYDNNPLSEGEKRQRIVVFITDGIPTLYVDTNKDQVLPVAQNAITIANDLKESALVYSIGIAQGVAPEKNFTSAANGWNNNGFDFNRFLHYVSSNYVDAESMSNGGNGSKDKGFFLAVENTDKLDSIFDDILYSAVYTVEAFDRVTLVDTISADFTLTMEQEEALRNMLIEEKGLGSDDVTITRNADGTTTIIIDNVKAEKVYDENGKAYYKAEVSFEVTPNKNALEPGEYETNTEDAGVMIDGAYVGKFEVPTIIISERRNIVVFTINGVVYRIDEGKLGDSIIVPETALAEWNIPEGTVIEGSYTEFEATKISDAKYKITWVVEDETFETYHTVGSVIEPIDVDVPAGMEFAGWTPAIRQTMPAANLTYKAMFKTAHEHNFVHVSHSGDCENGITVMYECECGETKLEELACTDHSYTAVIVPTDSKSISNIICTNEYCSKSQGNQLSYRCSYSLRSGRRTQVIEIDLYEKGVQVQLENGKIAIMVPLDSDIQKYNFTVTRIDEDNNETTVVSEKKDGYLIFYADHFSIFKITLIDESGEPTEDLSYSQCICNLNGHTYSEEVVEATCTTEGYTKYTCSNCGSFYFDNSVSATGHDYKKVSSDASCTQGGYDKYECTACGHTYVDNETDATEHDYEIVVTAPTCTTDGYTTYTCKSCKHSYVSDEVKSAGHKYTSTVVAPTCTTAGYTTYTCSVCEESYVGDTVAAKGHNIVDRVVESDCTNSGYTVHECTECDYSYVDSTTAENGHSYEKTVVPATCTTTGYTHNECSVCGHAYVSDETPIAAHTPGDWVLSADGKYVKVCTACNTVVETRISDIAINGVINGHSSMVVNYKMSKPLDVTAAAGKIIYTSADPEIASVDENGRVTGLKKGTTTITATIEGTNDSVTCEVKVEYTWWQKIIRIFLLGFLWY